MPVPLEYDRWMVAHHGVITRADFETLGFTARQTDRTIASQRLIRMGPGVYRSPSVPAGRIQWMVAACLRQPLAAIGFTTAGQEWGYRGMRDTRVHVLLPRGARLTLDGLIIHHSRRIDPVDVAGRRSDGIRLTSPPRTLFDSAAMLGRRKTVSAIEQALAERRCTLGTLMATSKRLFQPGRPAAVIFREALLSRAEWRGVARSDLELVVIEAITGRGLPAPIVNMPLVLVNGEDIVVDLAWPRWQVAVEVDHPFWHDGVVESARDKRRDRKLTMSGWQPVRFPELEIDHALPELIDDLAHILMKRGWEGAGR
ncbi:MAG: hypothetical protein U5K29_10430 [Acidimicrobiales bacterium]|nr:hypothetical protein [Acidimicrobiales bacterium]